MRVPRQHVCVVATLADEQANDQNAGRRVANSFVAPHADRFYDSAMSDDPKFHMIAGAAQPVAPFSHAVEADGWVLLTGQMPTDPDAPDAPLPDGIEAQTHAVMCNLEIVLAGLMLDLSYVVQCRIYLTQFERDYAAFNDVYQTYFPADRRPARTTIGVTALAVGALVEIDMVARRPSATGGGPVLPKVGYWTEPGA